MKNAGTVSFMLAVPLRFYINNNKSEVQYVKDKESS